jgi:uncharacterized protein DUF4304
LGGVTMSEIARIIDTVIREGLGKPLKEAGFRKSGRNFHLVADGVVRMVNVQASQFNFGAGGQFTLNLGVYLPEVAKFLKEKLAPGKLPTEYECTISVRIGSLMPKREDHWWKIDSSIDLYTLAEEVKTTWVKFGQPWLAQDWSDHNFLQDFLKNSPKYRGGRAASFFEQPTLESRGSHLAGHQKVPRKRR